MGGSLEHRHKFPEFANSVGEIVLELGQVKLINTIEGNYFS